MRILTKQRPFGPSSEPATSANPSFRKFAKICRPLSGCARDGDVRPLACLADGKCVGGSLVRGFGSCGRPCRLESRRYSLARASRNQSFGSGAEPGGPERRLQPAAAPTLAAAAKIPMRSGLARRCRLKPAFREQGCRVRMGCLGARNPRGTTRFPKILIDKNVCATERRFNPVIAPTRGTRGPGGRGGLRF